MRGYRLLLRLLPTSFRTEYGRLMAEAFAARRAEVAGPGVLVLWLETIADVGATAAAVHWDMLRSDLRVTARALRRAPAFTATAVAVVALGVGANTAAFSVADLVLLRPLPYANSDRLVQVWQRMPGYTRGELSPANWRDWRAAARTFDGFGIYLNTAANLTGVGDPQRVTGAAFSADILPLLGVQPVIGRGFAPGEDDDAAPAVVLLSWGLWQAQFGGRDGVLGTTVELDGRPHQVIGVMPRGFAFPRRDVALWTTARFDAGAYEDRGNTFLYGVARLRPGATLSDAQTELDVIAARLARQFPESNAEIGANVLRLRDATSEQARLLLVALCGAAACILLIGCANLASLLLARGLARRRELAVRAALGAGRDRLVRQLVTESVVLAGLGGLAGVALAWLVLPALTRLVPDALPASAVPSLDLRVLALAGAVTLAAALGFGVLPALRASRGIDPDALRDGGRAGGGRQRLRGALVATEVAASVVLLIAAGLLLRAMWRIQAVDPGFRTDSLLTMRTALPLPAYAPTATRLAFYRRVLDGVRALPGVESAAYISFLPMTMTGGIWQVRTDGDAATTGAQRSGRMASMRFATPEFFATMGIPLQRGRLLHDGDVEGAPPAAVVSASFAERFWPGEDPLGKTFRVAFLEKTVVGVVADIRVRGLQQASEPQMYLPVAQVPDSALIFYIPKDLVVRTGLPAAQLLPAIRRIVTEADPRQPISHVQTMAQIVAAQTASRATQLRLLGALALLAVILAGVGIHGLLAYTVSTRAQEFGVRMALGARPADIVRMVLRQGAGLALLGVLPGVVCAWLAGRAMRALLVGVPVMDLPTYACVVAACLAVTLAGCLLPARRAVRVDPLTALRAS